MSLRQAAQQALEALKKHGAHTPTCDHLMLLTSLPPQRKPCSCGLATAITALRAALAEPERPYDQTSLELCGVCGWRTLIPGDACLNCERSKQPEQEPVAWADMDVRGEDKGLSWTPGHFHKTPLYTAPTPRKPLTDDEIGKIAGDCLDAWSCARAIERAHGIGEQT